MNPQEKVKGKFYLEYESKLQDYEIDKSNQELQDAMYKSEIPTFGWPIAPVILQNERYYPRNHPTEIRTLQSEIDIEEDDCYDYWKINHKGEFYILMRLFEDRRSKNKIYFDTRIIRTAELLWRTGRLYTELGVNGDAKVKMRILYENLLGRELSAANQMRAFTLFRPRKCSLKRREESYVMTVSELQNEDAIVDTVYDVIDPIIQACENADFLKKETVVRPLVTAYMHGKVE